MSQIRTEMKQMPVKIARNNWWSLVRRFVLFPFDNESHSERESETESDLGEGEECTSQKQNCWLVFQK